MKKMWSEPRIAVQEFVPNEYVAACWEVGCVVGSVQTEFRNVSKQFRT